jgi:hypothetical protein
MFADGVATFRRRADVHLHSTPRIVFHKTQRPKEIAVYAARHLHRGYLRHAKRLDVNLRKSDRSGHRVWIAKFRALVRDRLFVDLTGYWRDTEGCGGPEDASWDFALTRVRPSG